MPTVRGLRGISTLRAVSGVLAARACPVVLAILALSARALPLVLAALALPASVAAQDGASGEAVFQRACVACHSEDSPLGAPGRRVLERLPEAAIVEALEQGAMRVQGSNLTPEERRAVAAYLSEVDAPEADATAADRADGGATAIERCSEARWPADAGAAESWGAWGVDARGRRHVPAGAAGLDRDEVTGLRLAWAYGLEGAAQVRSQPAVHGGRIFVGAGRRISALSTARGCELWSRDVESPARSGVTVVAPAGGPAVVVFGNERGQVLALDAATGDARWAVTASSHPTARVTGAPVHHEGRIYVPVSSLEVGVARDPAYECCTFRGGVVALDAADGTEIWRYHTISQEPRVQGESSAGTPRLGPSGAPVWSSPTVDADRGLLYLGAGENYTHPATDGSDAVHAVDLVSGEAEWVFQATAGDVWNMACASEEPVRGLPGEETPNCPEDNGPDFDFGMSPMVLTTAGGRDLLVVGQKSGTVFALDPEDAGRVVWSTRVSRGGVLGGIHWGMSAGDGLVFAAVSDRADGELYPEGPRPGITALDLSTGRTVWHSPAPPDRCVGREDEGCFPGYSAPPTSIPGVVFAGSLDGWIRAFDTRDGSLLWEFDTARSFETVNGVSASGGSLDVAGPVVLDGRLHVISGYGGFGQMPGNVLVTFAP